MECWEPRQEKGEMGGTPTLQSGSFWTDALPLRGRVGEGLPLCFRVSGEERRGEERACVINVGLAGALG